jgi:hypothetical protein
LKSHRLIASLVGALIAFSLGSVRVVQAADVPDKKDAAEKLFIEGQEAMSRGEQALACAKFHSSVDSFPVPNAVANVARCAERDGRIAEAMHAWEQVIAMLPPGDARIGPARERAAALAAKIPRLLLALPADLPADARILVDGKVLPRGEWKAPLSLAAGEHTVVVEALERKEQRFTITLTDGDRKELAVRAGPAPTGPTGPIAPVEPPSNRPRTAAFVAGGVGVAGFVIAGITGGMLLGRDAEIAKDCPDKKCSPDGLEQIAGSKPLLVANAVAWGFGLAGVGASAVLFITSRGRAAPATTVVPVVTSSSAGLTLVGKF